MSRNVYKNQNGQFYSGNTYLGQLNHNGTLTDAKGNTVGSFSQSNSFSGNNGQSGSVSQGGSVSYSGTSGASISRSGDVHSNNQSYSVKGGDGNRDSAATYFLMNNKK